MGMRLFGSSSSNDDFKFEDRRYKSFSPSPNPSNYEIIRHIELGKNLIVFIKYKDVTNYEGNKILVYKDCTLKQLTDQKLIDPHFSDNKNMFSPIARFEPTDTGWKLAETIIKSI
jgi:hypothetical protein